tara:strand:+ start:2117 stop:2887 length:771 start_codon:yes stop_codon:yes gene_type:complete
MFEHTLALLTEKHFGLYSVNIFTDGNSYANFAIFPHLSLIENTFLHPPSDVKQSSKSSLACLFCSLNNSMWSLFTLLHVRAHCTSLNPSNDRLRVAVASGDEQNLYASVSHTFTPPFFCVVTSRIFIILFVLVSALANHAPGAPKQYVKSLFKGTMESFKLNSTPSSSLPLLVSLCEIPSSSTISSGKLVASRSAIDIKSNGFDFSNWFRTKKVIAKNAAEWRSLRLIFFFWGGMEEKYDDDDDDEVGGGGIALRV